MSDNILRIMCPNLKCRAVLGVPQEARGKLVRCRACGTAIRVPVPKVQAGASVTEGQAVPEEAEAAKAKAPDAA